MSEKRGEEEKIFNNPNVNDEWIDNSMGNIVNRRPDE